MAGYDEGVGPSLYWCDYLATLHHMNICGTGYGEKGEAAAGARSKQWLCCLRGCLAAGLPACIAVCAPLYLAGVSRGSCSVTSHRSPPAPAPCAPAGSYFVLSMLDKLWHPAVTEAEAFEMMRKGVEEVKARLVVAPPKYLVKVIDAKGIRTLGEL